MALRLLCCPAALIAGWLAILKAAKWPTGSPPAASAPSSSATGSPRTVMCCPCRCWTPAAPCNWSAPAPADYQINPNRIVIIGFSAGGHLAALAGTQFVPGKPDAEDPFDRVSSRPDYLVLGYAWLGAISTDTSHLSYCKIFNLMDKCEDLRKAYEPELYVTKDTPPTFMYHTFNDQTVPIQQALSFYDALVKAGVSAEMHVFANGAHGSGLGKGDPALDKWPSLLEEWLRAQGLLTVDKEAVGAKP